MVARYPAFSSKVNENEEGTVAVRLPSETRPPLKDWKGLTNPSVPMVVDGVPSVSKLKSSTKLLGVVANAAPDRAMAMQAAVSVLINFICERLMWFLLSDAFKWFR